ncbi:GlxA family transcriptional regulator [Saccharospirillum impatiens]|uniref:GlxA family transcriptional regulator n=1 Tax=Saccharospirillum impatiens TaxID=169438 RepID=UPI00049147BB|nr:GlxA family transcriptional regulator [Saccharospirillum impatiens]
MRLDSPGETPEHIGLLLVPRFAMVALFSAIEPLRIANRLAGRALFHWTLISEDGQPVTASNGMPLGVDTSIAKAPACSSLAVCSSFAPEQAFRPILLDWLRERARQGCALGGMDTGCFILAQAGLLSGQTATLHWESLPEFRRCYPEVDAVESLFEVTSAGFSCAGGSSAIDMALALVRRRQGDDLANQVRDQLMHGRERLPASRQRAPARPTDPGLKRALALMERNLEHPLSLRELAGRAGLSWRHLERLCARHLGCSPRDHYQQLRLEHGHRLLLATDQPVLDIALACGFASSSTFTRAFRRRYDLTPSRLRRQDAY